ILKGTTVTIGGGTALTVSANGDGAGSGGSIHITTVDPTNGNVSIGAAAGNVKISANGGSTGAGGSITIDAAKNLLATSTN
ncbi:hypothetical protein ABTP95_21645, partial [Acinetobacter baumannii]